MTTKEFIQYAGEHPELCTKMADCKSVEEAYAIAKECGLTDEAEIFAAVLTEAKKETAALSESDLEQINAAGDQLITDEAPVTRTTRINTAGAATACI